MENSCPCADAGTIIREFIVKTLILLAIFSLLISAIACDGKKPDFVGTWQVRVPAADSLVTFVVSLDARGTYSVTGETQVLGGYILAGFRIENVRTEGDALKFTITSGIPIDYEVRAVSEDTLSGKMDFPTAKPNEATNVLWVRAKPD